MTEPSFEFALTGAVEVERRRDGELVGGIEIRTTDQGIMFHARRAEKSRWCGAAVARGGETQVFADLDDARRWVADHPGLPDLTRLDLSLLLVKGCLMRRVWAGPNGSFLALFERGLPLAAWPDAQACLYRGPADAPLQITVLRRRDGFWQIDFIADRRLRSRTAKRPSRALEIMAEASLGAEASAHERLAFAEGAEQRKALFAKLAEILHRRKANWWHLGGPTPVKLYPPGTFEML